MSTETVYDYNGRVILRGQDSAPPVDPYLLALRVALRGIFADLTREQRDRVFELRAYLRIAFDNHEPEETIHRLLADFDAQDDAALMQAKEQALSLPQWTVF